MSHFAWQETEHFVLPADLNCERLVKSNKHLKPFALRGIESKQPMKNLEIYVAKISFYVTWSWTIGFNPFILREGLSQAF